MHLADAFIQSDLQYIQAIHLYCQYVCSLGIEPTTFALLSSNALTTELQEHDTNDSVKHLFPLSKSAVFRKSFLVIVQWGDEQYS